MHNKPKHARPDAPRARFTLLNVRRIDKARFEAIAKAEGVEQYKLFTLMVEVYDNARRTN